MLQRFIVGLIAAGMTHASLAVAQMPPTAGAAPAQTMTERPADIVNEYIAPEDDFLQGASMYCLTPLIGDGDIVAHAAQEKLPEFTPEQAAALDANGGRAFGFPPSPQDQALIVRPGVGCSVVIRAVDATRLLAAASTYFGTHSPYRLLDEQTAPDGSVNRVYGADMGGPLTLYLSVQAQQPATGVQAMITIVRRPSTAAQ